MPDARAEALALLAVLAGGAAGSAARYAVHRLSVGAFPALADGFPWHTFGINVAGSLLLGVAAATLRAHPLAPLWLLVGTGFCGGFTTFSTFGLELVQLLDRGRPLAALLYAGGSVVAGVAGAWAGLRAGG